MAPVGQLCHLPVEFRVVQQRLPPVLVVGRCSAFLEEISGDSQRRRGIIVGEVVRQHLLVRIHLCAPCLPPPLSLKPRATVLLARKAARRPLRSRRTCCAPLRLGRTAPTASIFAPSRAWHRFDGTSRVPFLESAFTPCLWNWLSPACLYTTARSVTPVAHLMPQRRNRRLPGFEAVSISTARDREELASAPQIGFQLGFAEPPAFDSVRK